MNDHQSARSLDIRSVCIASLFALLGCSDPPAPAAPASPPPEHGAEPMPVEAPSAAAATPEQARQDCGQNLDAELPIVTGQLGEGERVVRLINNSGSEVQARLLDGKLGPAVAGTLRIPPQSTGEFKVPAGVYQVRYRDGRSCAVRRGAPLHLTGQRAGVEIAIKAKFSAGSKSKMRQVKEPL